MLPVASELLLALLQATRFPEARVLLSVTAETNNRNALDHALRNYVKAMDKVGVLSHGALCSSAAHSWSVPRHSWLGQGRAM